MKSIMHRIAVFAASAVVLGTTAFGQTMVMKAQIPFAFHSGNATLPAGSYTLTSDAHNATQLTRLRNASANVAVYSVGSPNDSWAAGRTAVIFRCGSEGCRLSAIRTAAGTITYYTPGKTAREKEVAVNAVLVRASNAD